MRNYIFAANWKMNKNPKETKAYFREFLEVISKEEESSFIFFPPAICLPQTAYYLKKTNVGWGAQNVNLEKSGAYTGENSPLTVADLGATHVLVGHSERRLLFNLSDEDVAKIVRTVQSLDMIPVICIGELEIQKAEGKTIDVIVDQIQKALSLSYPKKEFIISYEPVWSIGTGKLPSLETLDEIYEKIRDVLADRFNDSERAQKIRILYGGSVNAENVKGLSQSSNVDGFLVGGKSLGIESFYQIYKNTQKT